MMKNIFWKTVLLTVLATTLVACDEFFDTTVGGRIDPSEHYNSAKDAEQSYYGCFVYLQDIAEKMVLVDGLRSDQMIPTENADVDMLNINMHNFEVSNKYIDPADFYKIIINVNEVLPNLSQILVSDRDFDSTLLHQYEVSLMTLRSWAYFMLAKLNGEVGLIPADLSAMSPDAPVVYKTKDEIIDELINKLRVYDDPEDLYRWPGFDEDYAVSIYIDLYVLLGELYLEKGNYEGAMKYFKFAVDGPAFRNVFTVGGDYEQDDWDQLFYNSANTREEIFTAVPYSFVDGQGNSLEEWMRPNYSFMVQPSDTLINLFTSETQQNGDPGDVFRGYGISFDTTKAGIPFINKYSIDIGIPHGADVIIYRAADVHLMYAEALNRYGDHQTALALLNDGIANMASPPSGYSKWRSNIGVRGRVYLRSLNVPGSVTDVTEYIEDLIIEERAKELAFEGKRWFDLVRIAKRRGEPEYLAGKVASKFEDPEMAALVYNKLLDESNWYLPLPK